MAAAKVAAIFFAVENAGTYQKQTQTGESTPQSYASNVITSGVHVCIYLF